MTNDTKLPDKYAHDPERYRLLESGAVYDNELGHIVSNPGGGKYAITPQNVGEFNARRKQIGMLAQMRGLARSQGIELPDDAEIEEVARAAGTAIEALTMHMAKTFMESKNIRGMGEAFSKLVAGFIETDSRVRAENEPPANVPQLYILLAQYITQLNEDDLPSKSQEPTVDAEIIPDTLPSGTGVDSKGG